MTDKQPAPDEISPTTLWLRERQGIGRLKVATKELWEAVRDMDNLRVSAETIEATLNRQPYIPTGGPTPPGLPPLLYAAWNDFEAARDREKRAKIVLMELMGWEARP